ncbi:MAG: hypothetical protein KY453_03425 [Gemmatimonadetes bacterium]|nr:hypothetical protein [Gemmatimonadota bacterium]
MTVDQSGCQFRPERGTYHFSLYGDNRWWDYLNDPFMTGLASDMTERELDFLQAEAALRQGNTAQALSILNEYRVGNGELPPATAAGAPGGPDACVPQNPDGSCGDLWETLKYDKRIEVWHTGMGIAFWDDRGWGDLTPGTAVHFPVPGEELLVLLEEIYTFGGDAGGAAPSPSRLTLTPEAIRARLAALERFDASYAWRSASRMGVGMH